MSYAHSKAKKKRHQMYKGVKKAATRFHHCTNRLFKNKPVKPFPVKLQMPEGLADEAE